MEEQDIRREILDQISRNGKGVIDPKKLAQLAHKLGVGAPRIYDELLFLRDRGLIEFALPIEREPGRRQRREQCIFIGHGHSPVWRDLKDFLFETLHLQWNEFDREAFAGRTVIDVLDKMLKRATFAFLVMTAEDEHADGSRHARENVIHEIGLFQGRLGFKRAIVLLEEDCQQFTNLSGLLQIRFPRNSIRSTWEEVREVLGREGILAHTPDG